MDIGKPQKVYTIEPIESPVPDKQVEPPEQRPVEQPREPVPVHGG